MTINCKIQFIPFQPVAKGNVCKWPYLTEVSSSHCELKVTTWPSLERRTSIQQNNIANWLPWECCLGERTFTKEESHLRMSWLCEISLAILSCAPSGCNNCINGSAIWCSRFFIGRKLIKIRVLQRICNPEMLLLIREESASWSAPAFPCKGAEDNLF